MLIFVNKYLHITSRMQNTEDAGSLEITKSMRAEDQNRSVT